MLMLRPWEPSWILLSIPVARPPSSKLDSIPAQTIMKKKGETCRLAHTQSSTGFHAFKQLQTIRFSKPRAPLIFIGTLQE